LLLEMGPVCWDCFTGMARAKFGGLRNHGTFERSF
jgi:hypothetical protein